MELPEADEEPRFEWLEYRKKTEICYVSDFLKAHRGQPASFYETLDLADPNPDDPTVTKKYGNLSKITDIMYKKIVMHGQLESLGKIARKTGAASRDEDEKDYNYYDQNDSFIDDDADIPAHKNRNQMQLVCAQYRDFCGFEGGLAEFVKSDIYRHRLELLENVAREPQPEPLKKPEPALIETDKRPRDESLNKLAVDKVKKKQKKTPAAVEKDKPEAAGATAGVKSSETKHEKEHAPSVQNLSLPFTPTSPVAPTMPTPTAGLVGSSNTVMNNFKQILPNGGIFQTPPYPMNQCYPGFAMNPMIFQYMGMNMRGVQTPMQPAMPFIQPSPQHSQHHPPLPIAKKDSKVIEIDED